jgi:hypothetical protein
MTHPFAPPQARPAASPTAEQPTPLTAALDAHARPHDVYDVEGIFGLGGKAIPKVAIVVPRIGEQGAAIRDAHKALANDIDAVKSDPDALDNEKQVELLYRVTRNAEKPSEPAFAGPKWMRENLTTDHLAALLNLLGVTRRKHGPGGLKTFAPEEVDLFARQLHASESGEAYANLARMAHVDLSGLTMVLASRYVAMASELEALQPLRDRLAAEMAENTAEAPGEG